MRYKWRRGARQTGSAQEVGETLRQLADGGELDPVDVVKAARPVRSPLHRCFDWDDSSAAHQHRVWQARCLIKSVVVVVESLEDADEPTPVFLNIVDAEGERNYYEVETVVDSPTLYGQALVQAKKELYRTKKRYEHLKELQQVWEAIRETA